MKRLSAPRTVAPRARRSPVHLVRTTVMVIAGTLGLLGASACAQPGEAKTSAAQETPKDDKAADADAKPDETPEVKPDDKPEPPPEVDPPEPPPEPPPAT